MAKVPTKYMAFKEYCEWEGETWRFYVPIRGDHYANLCWLEGKLKSYGMSEFTVIQKELTEKEVDALCKDSKGGYMAFHNKMEGTIDLKELDKAGATKESLSEFLYKGGIENLFKKA
jgi:hypothetical protein